ncbi:MAG: hypothetical protein HYS57_01815 [Parcubacteria group bacterium]|nr:hypothetical protein [Parcubacteria group bacterium]
MLELILQHQAELVGCQVVYEERMPEMVEFGSFKSMEVLGETLHLHSVWDGGVDCDHSIALNFLEVQWDGSEIAFWIRAVGTFGGRTTIFFP